MLRARRLDVTLTSAAPDDGDAERVAPTGVEAIDGPLRGGLRRGHLSEIVGPRSSGRSTLVCAIASTAMQRGEVVALIDTHDRFDPAAAAALGLDLGRLLWIRDTGNADRALKAMNLVLQAGGFGVAVLDLADASGPAVRRFPHTTWMRLSRVIEGSPTVALLVGAEHLARSPGGVTIALHVPSAGAGEWHGSGIRSMRLGGLAVRPRIISARSAAAHVSGPLPIDNPRPIPGACPAARRRERPGSGTPGVVS